VCVLQTCDIGIFEADHYINKYSNCINRSDKQIELSKLSGQGSCIGQTALIVVLLLTRILKPIDPSTKGTCTVSTTSSSKQHGLRLHDHDYLISIGTELMSLFPFPLSMKI
jgi:hypothetical protein